MRHSRLPRSFVWLSFIPVIFLIGWFAFHYSRLTDFPIGDDPAIHISTVKQVGILPILRTSYPLPLLIFKGAHLLTGIDYTLLFIYLICGFLLLGSLALGYFVWVGWGSWVMAIVAPLLFVADRWVNDGLRMGVFAETFGWAMLFLALTSLIRQRWWAVLLWTVILALSHPFALLIYGLIVFFNSLIVLRQGEPEEKRSAIYLICIYIIAGVLIFFIKPDIINRFVDFMSTDPSGWGDRSLWRILTSDDDRRLIIPMIGFFGLATVIGQWERPAVRVTILLLGLGLFLSLNQLFGVNFIPFRFYVYLDAAIAILAAAGIAALFDHLDLPKMLNYPLAIMAALVLLWPNYQVNQLIGHWQATNGDARAVMLAGDRVALTWIRLNTPANAAFIADRRYAIWISSVGERTNIDTSSIPYDETSLVNYYNAGYHFNQQYVYFGLDQQAPASLPKYFRLAFQDDGVSIWEQRP